MNANSFWQAFLQTGDPDIYLLYNWAKKMEDVHVFDDSGVGAAGNDLQ